MIRIAIFLLLLGGIILGVYLIGQKTGLFSHASSINYPDKINISNLSDTSFTVSWFTPDKPSHQFLSYGTSESLGNIADDDRGQQNLNTHYITLKNLQPDTDYFLRIGPNSPIFKQRTAQTISTPPPLPERFFGSAHTKAKITPNEAIVYLKTGNGQLLSAIADKGSWDINLGNSRTQDFSSFLSLQPTSPVEIYVQSSMEGEGYIRLFAFNRKNSIEILLSNEKIPFFTIQLGSNKSKPSSQKPNSTQTAPDKTKSNNGIFDVLWVPLTGKSQ